MEESFIKEFNVSYDDIVNNYLREKGNGFFEWYIKRRQFVDKTTMENDLFLFENVEYHKEKINEWAKGYVEKCYQWYLSEIEDEKRNKAIFEKKYRQSFKMQLTQLQKVDYLNCSCVQPYKGAFACGRCSNCLSGNVTKWFHRLMCESHYSSFVISACLTYTDDMLQTKTDVEDNKELYEYYRQKYNDEIYLLDKTDMQKFIKRLRYFAENRYTLKYYIKGEYGDTNGRPHYHVLIFVYTIEFVTEKDVINDILKSWYDGLLKYRNMPINMELPENVGKEIKVNPIVEIEDFNEECAKYTIKYTANSLELVKKIPALMFKKEFILSSNQLGTQQFKDQIEEHRKLLNVVISKDNKGFYNNNDEQFLKDFKQVVTFFSEDGVPLYLPKYLKSNLFLGYYRYVPKELRKNSNDKSVKYWQIPKRFKGLVEYETFDPNQETSYLLNKVAEKFAYLLDKYLTLQRDKKLKAIDNVDDLYLKRLQSNKEKDEHRKAGCIKERLTKIEKRKKWKK